MRFEPFSAVALVSLFFFRPFFFSLRFLSFFFSPLFPPPLLFLLSNFSVSFAIRFVIVAAGAGRRGESK